MTEQSRPVILCILDGWGHREEADHNAIAAANTPNWDAMLQHYPHGTINASEGDVGLPDGQMGNSEVGHMNIGAGRIVMQDLPRIDAAIANGSLASNKTLGAYIKKLKQSGGDCHLMGLLSDGGVHSHQNHIIALAKLVAAAGVHVWIHAFLDGRDTPPRSAKDYLHTLHDAIEPNENIQLASICGRYFAMDRDTRWDRVQKAYDLLVNGKGASAEHALSAISRAYEEDDTGDEFVQPYVLEGYDGMDDGDGILMANFRADRARQILHALLDPTFNGFKRKRVVSFTATAGMVEYSFELNKLVPALFPAEVLNNMLGEIIANAGLTQLRIAETEKYAHVTFFMSGGREEPFKGEERILVPSPDVATYDLKPEMSAYDVTDQLVDAISNQRYDVIIVNYANGDMVGHTGDMNAAIAAVEAVDTCLGRLVEAVKSVNAAMIITADHGNVELMQSQTSGQAHTAHTLNLVPFVCVSNTLKEQQFPIREGRLADLAPTVLQLAGLDKPVEMTGESLLPNNALGDRAIA